MDSKIDLSIFDDRYNNDLTGVKAIEPRILLKIILIVKVLSSETEPHYTTISNFVSGMGDEIEKVFGEVLLVCHELKLIIWQRKGT